MNSNFEKQFLHVLPYEEQIIPEYDEVDHYIYKTIISKPSKELLMEINRIINCKNISGIITRGSMANFLYNNNVKVPIFELKLSISAIISLLHKCFLKGYRKICIFEISYDKPQKASQNIYTHTSMGTYELSYYKMFRNNQIEATIAELSRNKSIDILIGDFEPTLIASKYNIPVENFMLGNDCWKETINQAKHATDITVKEKSKNNFIEVITNIISEAVIIIDNKGLIKRYNLQAENIFFKDVNYNSIQDLFNMNLDIILKIPANFIIKIHEANYVLNLIPIILHNEQLYAIIINNVKYVENMEMSIRTQNQKRGLLAKTYFKNIICKDINTRKIVESSKKYAKSNSTIIIYGETGTGKEVFASSIHNESLRANGPFVAINCATFNENLIESELFGYEKGSFTGALSNGKKGLFELAHKGSIFLDEIGELPLNLQGKLLRVIQEKEIMRIGGDKIIPIDVRIIAATNKNLMKMVNQNLFREDLYYRLALLEIEIPPLRERLNDIIPLFVAFLAEISERENKSVYWDDTSIFDPLLHYDWPGNIRELRNFAERIILLLDENKLTKSFINNAINKKHNIKNIPQYSASITCDLKKFESDYIKFLLKKFGDDKENLCDYLNISKATLWRKLNNK